jgi:hypothetical protein
MLAIPNQTRDGSIRKRPKGLRRIHEDDAARGDIAKYTLPLRWRPL